MRSVLLYACETWKHNTTIINKLQVFLNRCHRRILNVRWPDTIYSEELWQKTKQQPILAEIKVENGVGLVTLSGNDLILSNSKLLTGTFKVQDEEDVPE
jgi:hypothetical protein